MSYAATAKVSEAQPCTNVPIYCHLCRPNDKGQRQTIWKYNTWYHLISEHANEEGNIPPLLPQIIVDTHILKAEESAIGIGPETTGEWRAEHDLANSSDVEDAKESLKRDRTASNVAAEPHAKSRRTNRS